VKTASLATETAPIGLTALARPEVSREAVAVWPNAPLSFTGSDDEEAWTCKDESRFWVWLVRCSDQELDDFIEGRCGPNSYLGYAAAERRSRRQERLTCPGPWSLAALPESLTSALARLTHAFHQPHAP
jgi:hypothetical protein